MDLISEKHAIANGVSGTCASFAGILISVSDLEVGLRICSLLVGLLVGLVTLRNITRKKRR